MTHAYTEDQLVEQPAIGLFAELGWQTVSAVDSAGTPAGGDEKTGLIATIDRQNIPVVSEPPYA